jgi:hypothetical protein
MEMLRIVKRVESRSAVGRSGNQKPAPVGFHQGQRLTWRQRNAFQQSEAGLRPWIAAEPAQKPARQPARLLSR